MIQRILSAGAIAKLRALPDVFVLNHYENVRTRKGCLCPIAYMAYPNRDSEEWREANKLLNHRPIDAPGGFAARLGIMRNDVIAILDLADNAGYKLGIGREDLVAFRALVKARP